MVCAAFSSYIVAILPMHSRLNRYLVGKILAIGAVLKFAKKPIDDLINQNLKICMARWITKIYDTPFFYPEGDKNKMTRASLL